MGRSCGAPESRKEKSADDPGVQTPDLEVRLAGTNSGLSILSFDSVLGCGFGKVGKMCCCRVGWLELEQVGATDLLLAKTLLLEVRVVAAVPDSVLLLGCLAGLLASSTLMQQRSVSVAKLVRRRFLTLTLVPLDAETILP